MVLLGSILLKAGLIRFRFCMLLNSDTHDSPCDVPLRCVWKVLEIINKQAHGDSYVNGSAPRSSKVQYLATCLSPCRCKDKHGH